jgi:hypothetical protein
MDEILHQRKTSIYGPQNVEEIPLQQHIKKGSLIGLPSLYLSGRN